MKKRFVLIDHSVQKYGGHNLEYAIHVLRAAEQQGYRPTLITNRELVLDRNDRELEGIDVHPLYLFDFWGNAGKPRKKKPLLKKLRTGFHSWKTKRKIAFTYSNIGLLLSMQNHYQEYLRNTPHHTRNVFLKLLLLFPIIYLLMLLRGAKRSLRLLAQLSRRTWMGSVIRFLKETIKSFSPLLKAFLSPLIFLNRHKKNILSRHRKNKRIDAFGKDTLRMMNKVGVSEGDVIFIPTLSEFDMLGLLHAFRKNANSLKASWHLLFRRNVFIGRDPQYLQQREHLQIFRKKFLYFKNQTPSHQVFFYTDTDKLTDQYDFLKTVPFKTLPIPINTDFQTQQRNYESSGPIKITYIGDARREKGYQYLPDLVRGLYASYIKQNKVKFIAQSNFGFTEYQYNSDILMARYQLENFAEGVEVIKDSLTTSQYKDLVLASDIGVILYDRDNYYARSSGALVEYLSAGIPVVVPSGSWMADQIADCTYDYHNRLRDKEKHLTWGDGSDFEWINRNGRDSKMKGNLSFGGQLDSSECTFIPPQMTEYVMLSFEFDSAAEGVYVSLQFSEHNLAGVLISRQMATVGKSYKGFATSALFRMKPSSGNLVSISFHNAFEDHTIKIKNLRFHFYGAIGMPTASVGIIVDSSTEAVTALEDMVEYYPHYRKTAQEFSVEWNNRHSAGALVSQLTNRGTKL